MTLDNLVYGIPWSELAGIFSFFIGGFFLISLIASRWTPFTRWLIKPFKDLLGFNELMCELGEIKRQVTLTNGTVLEHSRQLAKIEYQLGQEKPMKE